jgi:hypothetical protein
LVQAHSTYWNWYIMFMCIIDRTLHDRETIFNRFMEIVERSEIRTSFQKDRLNL